MERYSTFLEGSIQVTHEHQGTVKKPSNTQLEQQTMSTAATLATSS